MLYLWYELYNKSKLHAFFDYPYPYPIPEVVESSYYKIECWIISFIGSFATPTPSKDYHWRVPASRLLLSV